MNSVQADDGHLRGSWQLPGLPGLEARSDVLKPIVIDSDLCVSSGSVAFGFHDRACAQEFVDPQSLRQSGGTPETTGVTPRPTPTPTRTSTQPTPIRPPQVTKPLAVEDTLRLLFALCTPWHFQDIMYAQWYGTAYGYSYTCDLTEGALPIFWEEVCRGGKVQQP